MRIELAHRADVDSGYGTLVRQLRRGLEGVGAFAGLSTTKGPMDRVVYAPKTPALVRITDQSTGRFWLRWVNPDGTPAVIGSRMNRWVNDHDPVERGPDPITRIAVRLCPTLPRDAEWDGASTRVLFTMWESSQVPTENNPWAPELERADLILTPCEYSRRVLSAAVPGLPIEVVPLALEPEMWPLYDRRDRSERRPFVFLMVGDISYRKGWDAAYQAFWNAFGNRTDVQLVVKVRGQSPFSEWVWREDERSPAGAREFRKDRVGYRWESGQANVRILRGNWSRRALLKLYRAADAFVWPTRGEGWGYPPREAVATGLPVVTCAHTGQDDAERWAYLIPYEPDVRPAFFASWGNCGHIAEPDVDALTDTMLWLVANREESLDFAEAASHYVKGRTPVDLASDVVAAIERYETAAVRQIA